MIISYNLIVSRVEMDFKNFVWLIAFKKLTDFSILWDIQCIFSVISYPKPKIMKNSCQLWVDKGKGGKWG